MDHERALKVLVLGDCNTGKTTLIKRCVYDIYSTKYNSTVGVDFSLKKLSMGDEDVRLQLWDIAGQVGRSICVVQFENVGSVRACAPACVCVCVCVVS